MAKSKKDKEEVEVEETSEPIDELASVREKRDALIAEIVPKLLTNAQLKEGGAGIRTRHLQEKGYEVVMSEINDLGKKLSLSPIGLGNLRS